MIFVLSGMVGYLYWQQTRMLQQLQSLALVISVHLTPPKSPIQDEEPVQESVSQEETTESVHEEEVDDRVSVKAEVEHVEGPSDDTASIVTQPAESTPAGGESDKVDVDDLQGKTAAQLRDMLTKKGIPFGKRDAKPVLIQLLKATA